MEEKNELDSRNDDVMMPGFRFHPTDEELVGFYLKRKLQQRPLPIELIKPVDIYKYDPWDLPKLATTGEKEWYFYCPRDRKYRNSTRPNRVTESGFWKATGTDRPIYSTDGTMCIGLKKSLVFYKGRAAKGIKTDWMMHEFRLPSLGELSPPNKKLLDKKLPLNDAWAVCRIFKKTNSGAQRALSRSWVFPFEDTSPSDIFSHHFSSENFSCVTDIGSVFHLSSTSENFVHQQASSASLSASDVPPSTSYWLTNSTLQKPSLPLPNGRVEDLPDNFMFSPLEISTPTKSSTVIQDTCPMLLNPDLIGEINNESESLDFEGSQENFNGFLMSLLQDRAQKNLGSQETDAGLSKVSSSVSENYPLASIRSLGFPFSLSPEIPDAWKPNLPWESPPCPSEITTTYSTNKCYT